MQALVFADVNAIKEYSVKLGAGEDLYVLFAGILTMKPWKRVINPSVDHLVLEGTNDNRSELQVISLTSIRNILSVCQTFCVAILEDY